MTPKYIQELMARASFDFSQNFCSPGYTIKIAKRSNYEHAQTLKEHIEQLAKWVKKECRRLGMDREGADNTIVINRVPGITRYSQQFAFVTIYDPIMQNLEKYISSNIH